MESGKSLNFKGKINSIAVDNCKKHHLVVNDLNNIVESIYSRDGKVQVASQVPKISTDKADVCHTCLSKHSLDCEIVQAKYSENILIPREGLDFDESQALEQFKTLWNWQKLYTTVTEIAG